MTRRTHVFSGPSLSAAEVRALVPRALCHPPVRHGDLLAAPIETGDRVVVLDGVFQHAASVRHKEICELIAAGVEVWGAASMGALRAVELEPHGMLGAGTVYRLFRSGLLERDDEVALVHTEPDSGSQGGSRALTVALVSVRVLVRRLRRHGRIQLADEHSLVHAAERTDFTERSWRRVLDTAEGLADSARCAVEVAVAGPGVDWDVKARDAARLLRALPSRDLSPRPVVSSPLVPSPLLPIPQIGTMEPTIHVERWRRRARPDAEHLVTATALYADDYPILHRRVILALIAGLPDPAGAHGDRLCDTDLEAQALAAADRRGLVPRRCTERDLLTQLVSNFGWSGGLAPIPVLAAAISATPGGATITELVEAAARLNRELAERGHRAAYSSRSALLRHLRRRWALDGPDDQDGFDTAGTARGFRDTDDLHERAAWFTPQLVLTNPAPVILQPAGTTRRTP